MRQVAGARDVAAVDVDVNTIGVGDVGRYRLIETLVGAFGDVDGYDPLQAVSGRTAEEQLSLEVLVLQQSLEEASRSDTWSKSMQMSPECATRSLSLRVAKVPEKVA